MRPTFGLAVLLISVVLPLSEAVSEGQPTPGENGQFGIGVQGAPFPIVGISAIWNASPTIGLQAIGKTGFDVDVLAGRILYRFGQRPGHSWHATGLIGHFRDPDVSRTPLGMDETDQAVGFGFGVGFEHFFAKIPHMGFGAEIDFIHIGFDDVWWQYDYESFSLVMLGLGLHYYP